MIKSKSNFLPKIRTRRRRFFKSLRFRHWMSIGISVIAISTILGLYLVKLSPGEEFTVDLENDGAETIRQVQVATSFRKVSELGKQLDDRMKTARPAQKPAILKILLAISVRRAEIAPNEIEKDKARRDQLGALQALAVANSLVDAERRGYIAEMIERANQWKIDPNPDISFQAYRALLLSCSIHIVSAEVGDGTVERVAAILAEAIGRFPDEGEFVKAAERILDRCPKDNAWETEFTKLASSVVRLFENTAKPEIVEWAESIRDKQLLVEKKVVATLNAANSGNEKAIEDIRALINQLLGNRPSLFGITTALQLGYYLEGIKRSDDARQVFEQVVALVESDSKKSELVEIKAAANLGLERLKLIGQTPNFSIKDIQGETLNDQTYHGSHFLACFVANDADVKEVARFLEKIVGLEQMGLRVVVIGLELEPEQLSRHLTKFSSFVKLAVDPDRTGDLTVKGKVRFTPFSIVFDKSGKIIQMANVLGRLAIELESHIFEN